MNNYVPSNLTLQGLRELLASGALTEGHNVDFKRTLESGEKGNQSIAKDLAAFAIDGGVILIGLMNLPIHDQPLSQFP